MKKTLVAIVAAMGLMAYGHVAPSAYANSMNRSDTGMYQKQSSMKSSGSYDLKQLMGKDVNGIDGQKFGSIQDFVIDPTGHVFALISSSDLQGKKVAVPFEAFSSMGADRNLTLNLSKDQLAKAPSFDQAAMASTDWGQDIYRQYGLQPSWSASSQGTSSQSGTSRQYGTSQKGQMISSNNVYDVKQLMGKDVKGIDGQKVGSLQDFVLDPNGHVFALLSGSDLQGKRIAIPFEAFSSVGADNTLTINLSKDQLAKAPEFNLASLSDPTWSQDLYRQYGIQPSWTTQQGTRGQSGTFQRDQSRGQYQGQQPGSQSGGQPGPSRSY